MPIWSNAQLDRFTLQGEEEFVRYCRCIIDRVALDIEEETSVYTLPDEVLDIRRITYRGEKLEPISHRKYRDYFDGINSNAEPTHYIYDSVGQKSIKLFPTPIEDLPTVTSGLLTSAVIEEKCIVEYYAIPDNVNYALPAYMRRRLLKAYVLKQAFAIEGQEQNIKASRYWKQKWESMKELYSDKLNDLLTRPEN